MQESTPKKSVNLHGGDRRFCDTAEVVVHAPDNLPVLPDDLLTDEGVGAEIPIPVSELSIPVAEFPAPII